MQLPTAIGERSIAAQIDELHDVLQNFAEDQKWSELAAAMKRRNELLSRVGADDRASVFRAALCCNGRILELVGSGRTAVTNELLALRRRHDAISQYE